MYELTTHENIRQIGQETWARLAGASAPPFVRWEFLDALEQTGCVAPRRGWMPLHVLLRRDGDPVAAMPAYLKGNSEGEFVFDHGWARFAEERLRIPYYPKLIVAAPFTPATGPRLLCAEEDDANGLFSAAVSGLSALVQRLSISSAHVLFPTESQAASLSSAGMVRRYGIQYHWRNQDYSCFDDFLSCFSSKRRHQIKRERRELEKQNVEIVVRDGKEAKSSEIDYCFECYVSTTSKYFWGRQYLNRDFFHEICARLGDGVMLVLARDKGSRKPIASAFNLVGQTALYGRYWGATEERPYLHFNVCYYAGIEQCIERRLSLFEPGAGGEHKVPRGFEPVMTHSAHHVADARLAAVVDDFVRREREALAVHIGDFRASPVVRPLSRPA